MRFRRLAIVSALVVGAGLAAPLAASAAPTTPVHPAARAMPLDENLGLVAVTRLDLTVPPFHNYVGQALYVNSNVLSQGLFPVIYTQCDGTLTGSNCHAEEWTAYSDTGFTWVYTGDSNWYWLRDNSNPSLCVAFAASTPNTPLVVDTCQGVSWEEFYWAGCHQGIKLRYNALWFYYQADSEPMGLNSFGNSSEMAWTSGYAGCTSTLAG